MIAMAPVDLVKWQQDLIDQTRREVRHWMVKAMDPESLERWR